MATFGGDCEPLHGHNYDVLIEIEGPLTTDGWVWDFGAVKRAARELAELLDHKFLLQARSDQLSIVEAPSSWTVSFGERSYTFPRSDVLPLPTINSTAECIAEWFAGELLTRLRAQGADHITRLTVGIEEMPGQAGWYTLEA